MRFPLAPLFSSFLHSFLFILFFFSLFLQSKHCPPVALWKAPRPKLQQEIRRSTTNYPLVKHLWLVLLFVNANISARTYLDLYHVCSYFCVAHERRRDKVSTRSLLDVAPLCHRLKMAPIRLMRFTRAASWPEHRSLRQSDKPSPRSRRSPVRSAWSTDDPWEFWDRHVH